MAKLSRKRLPQGRKGCAYYDTSFFRFSRLTVLEPDRAVAEAAGGAECRQGGSGSGDDDAEDDLPKILLHTLMVLVG